MNGKIKFNDMGWHAEKDIDKIVYEKYFNEIIGTIVEVGAANPTYLSISSAFKEKGWRAICVEPNPYFVKMHENEGNEIYQYALSDEIKDDADFFIHSDADPNSQMSYSSLGVRHKGNANLHKIKVNVRTLNWLLESLKIEKIDLLTIDTEGWEIEVMKGFNVKKYMPKIIVLENIFKQSEYDNYMQSINFNLESRIAVNSIYINACQI